MKREIKLFGETESIVWVWAGKKQDILPQIYIYLFYNIFLQYKKKIDSVTQQT